MQPITVLFFVFFLACQTLIAQQISYELKAELESAFSTSSQMPFWFVHNQSGKYSHQESPGFLLSLGGYHRFDKALSSRSILQTGARLIASSAGDRTNLNFNELYADLSWPKIKLTAGLFTDEIAFGGLSSTNGNIARSLNARPYPKVQLTTNGYIPLFSDGDWLKFSAEYSEGLLNDRRYMDGVHLHHKSIFFLSSLSPTLSLKIGVDHFVMWGGISPDERIGKMPESLSAYFRYVFGQSGDDEFPETDQINVTGNQYGSYTFQLKNDFEDFSLTLNLSHPFDDRSGTRLANLEDNLYGLFLDIEDREQFLTKLIYEFTFTKKQGLDTLYQYDPETGEWGRKHDDDYYNHGVYRSGVTYHGYGMVSPLFAPVIEENGVPMGFRNSRFISHHLGASGNLTGTPLTWKALLTYTRYFGTWRDPLIPSQRQLSGLLELYYRKAGSPFDFSLSFAADKGQLYRDHLGILLKVSKSW